jgi:hypothetical protein
MPLQPMQRMRRRHGQLGSHPTTLVILPTNGRDQGTWNVNIQRIAHFNRIRTSLRRNGPGVHGGSQPANSASRSPSK